MKQQIDYNSRLSVPVTTLASVVEDLGLQELDVLKIDTQGFEKEVLKGCGTILHNTLIVETEVIFSDAYEKSSSIGGIQDILTPYGFVLWDIPYIGKFASDEVNRINFVDVIFVNVAMLNR